MPFPDDCIRGIHNDQFLSDDGVGAHLFYFNQLDSCRDDKWCELSINWNDDEDAIEFTLNQTKRGGEIKFKAGAAIIPKEHLDHLDSLATIIDRFSYERKPLDDNSYHGNLLLKEGTPKPTMEQLAASIALGVTEVIPNHNLED